MLTHAQLDVPNFDGVSLVVIDREVQLGPGHACRALLDVTSNGNGVLYLSGFRIRVYDVHDNGVVHSPGMLISILMDVDGDGYRDLIVAGEAAVTDEAGTSIDRRQISQVHLYSPATRSFGPASVAVAPFTF